MDVPLDKTPTVPNIAMNPASVWEHPSDGQSQSWVPCFAACSGHAGSFFCIGQSAMPSCPDIPACSSAGPRSQESTTDATARISACHTSAHVASSPVRLRMNRISTIMVCSMTTNVKVLASIFVVVAVMAGTVEPLLAQDPAPLGWRWVLNGNVFAGMNYQHRKFDDITTVESQNWLMGQGERPLGPGHFTVHTMVSFEPFTLKNIGSPQVFQTGETFKGLPLIHYQHPHDLFATLSAAYARPLGAWTLRTSGAIVGAPALGPPPFMHRPSATENPQSPLAHHHLDSFHITPGVITIGLNRAGFGVDGSWFHGREADEQRTDIDFGALDSWSVRGSWTNDSWSGQLSAARVNEPDPLNPGDMTRLTASVSYTPHRTDHHCSVLGLGAKSRTPWNVERRAVREQRVMARAKSPFRAC